MLLLSKDLKSLPGDRIHSRLVRKALKLLWLCLCISSIALAQTSSTNFGVTGGFVGGGGASASSGYSITGDIPLMPGGISTSSGYTAIGGTFIHTTSNALTAFYTGSAVQTVSVAARTLTVNYGGGSGNPVSGTFYYRQGGQSVYSDAPMNDNGSGVLTYNLGANLLTVRGLEYYFAVSQDGILSTVGSPADPYVFRVSLTNAQGQRPTAMPDASYRIIGLPLVPSTTNATTVFVDDLGTADSTQWRLGSYNNNTGEVNEYPSVAAVTPGQGYWLIARGAKRYGSDGTTIRPNYSYGGNAYYEVPLDSGWNMFANPLPFDISFAAMYLDTGGVVVASHPASIIDNAAHYYNGSGYTNASTIPAWEGVFIHANRSGVSALVRYSESAVGSPAAKPLVGEFESDEWSLELILRSGDKTDAGNLIGMKYDALETRDQYDFTEPPPAPDAPYLALKIPGDDKRLSMSDFRPEFDDGAVWNIELSPAANRTVTLQGLAGLSLWETALEFDNHTIIYPHDGQVISVPDEVSAARLIIGSKHYLASEQAGLPQDYALDQNFPNPFNPMTSIRFVVPSQAHVRLDIHNILGQQVKTLIDETLPRGEYTVMWHGTDENDQPVASGIYFYRIQADEYSQCRKMVLLK